MENQPEKEILSVYFDLFVFIREQREAVGGSELMWWKPDKDLVLCPHIPEYWRILQKFSDNVSKIVNNTMVTVSNWNTWSWSPLKELFSETQLSIN